MSGRRMARRTLVVAGPPDWWDRCMWAGVGVVGGAVLAVGLFACYVVGDLKRRGYF